MTERGRHIADTADIDGRLARLAEHWPAGSLVRHRETGRHGVITVADDPIARQWNHGLPGHVALRPKREEVRLGGMLHVAWEHADPCWNRIALLELLDRAGLYDVWPQEPGRSPVYRLAVGAGDPHWWDRAASLPAGWSWAARDDQALVDALHDARHLGGRR